MSISIQIKADVKEVENLLSGLGRGADKVITRALNRTITSVKSVAVKSIAKDIRVKQKVVRQSLRLSRASYRKKRAYVEAEGGRIPLIDFNARKINRGVSYNAPSGGRRTITGAFQATMQSGHTGIFKRTGIRRKMRSGRYKGKVREAITELHGASIPYVMLQKSVKAAMDTVARERWETEIRAQIKYFLRHDRGTRR